MSADVAGSIQVPGEVDQYVFTVSEDKQVYFDSLSNANMTWSLSGPRGAVVTNRDFRSSDSWDIGGNPVLFLTAGDYLLSVDATGDTVGDYSARLVDLVPPPRGVTREGVLRGERAMLDAWWDELDLGSIDHWRLWKQPLPPLAR